jgi:hypothetical protein
MLGPHIFRSRPMLRLLVCFLLLATPALAAQEWRQARDLEVRLSNFDMQPATITLQAGQPVRLRLVNVSPAAHSFSADDFFARAQLRGRERRLVSGGKVLVPANDVRELVLIPAPGRYRARTGNLLTRLLGMSSEIVVQ